MPLFWEEGMNKDEKKRRKKKVLFYGLKNMNLPLFTKAERKITGNVEGNLIMAFCGHTLCSFYFLTLL